MLYTVVPLERVYKDHNIKENKLTEENAEYREVMLPHGRVVTRRDGENYVIHKINSTDMSDYINEDYSPGKVMK